MFKFNKEDYERCIRNLGEQYWNYNAFGDSNLSDYDIFDLVVKFGTYDKKKYGNINYIYKRLFNKDVDFLYYLLKEADINYLKFGKEAILDGLVDNIIYDGITNNNELYYALSMVINNWKKNNSLYSQYEFFKLLFMELADEYYEEFCIRNKYNTFASMLKNQYLGYYNKLKSRKLVEQTLLKEYEDDLNKIYKSEINQISKCDVDEMLSNFLEPVLYKIEGHTLEDFVDKKFLDAFKKLYIEIIYLSIKAVGIFVLGSKNNSPISDYILQSKKLARKDCLSFLNDLTVYDFIYDNKFILVKNEKIYSLLGLNINNYKK